MARTHLMDLALGLLGLPLALLGEVHNARLGPRAAQSVAEETGQVTLTPSAPRLNSRWIASAATA